MTYTLNIKYTQPYLVLLRFADTVLFTNWRSMVTPALNKSIGTILPTAFAHFVTLCHILVIPIFQSLHKEKDYNLLKPQKTVSIF